MEELVSIRGAQGRLIWIVETRKEIRIWGSKWLPALTTYKIQSLRKSIDATGSDLIDEENKEWKEPLVKQGFNKKEAP